jgi:Xaa-Pro aminopeptidase
MNQNLPTFLSRLPENAFIELCGATEQLRNGDVHYPFRQDSDFLYLTGLSVPDLVITIFQKTVILWRPPINDHDILWGSEKLADDEIVKISGIEDIRDISDLTSYKTSLCSSDMFDPRELLTRMRLSKTPDEIVKIRQAITITNRAFERVKKEIQAGMYEYEIEAIFAHEFRKHHVTEAYPTIVASGSSACTLHYTKNTRRIEK